MTKGHVNRQAIFTVQNALGSIQFELDRHRGSTSDATDFSAEAKAVVEGTLDVIYHGRSYVRGGTAIAQLLALGLPPSVAEDLSDYTRDIVLAGLTAVRAHPHDHYEYTYSIDDLGNVVLLETDPRCHSLVDPLADQLRDELEDGAYLPERLRRRVGLC